MGALLALRRLQRDEIAVFLRDSDPAVVLEAARAINDEPINGALRELAALISDGGAHAAGVPVAAARRDEPGASVHQANAASPGSRSSAIGSLGGPPSDARGPRALPKDAYSEPLLRRVLNANFHFGTKESAKALATFAARSDAAENMRVEALEELADWPRPSGRDRVVGLWRPVAAVRQRETAVEALQTALAEILRSAPDSVRVAAVHAAGRLTFTGAGPVLSELVADTKISSRVRVEALNVLAALDNSRLEEALNSARAEADEDLRRAATLLQGKVKSSNAATKLAAILGNGSLGEKQAALAALGALQEPAADDVLIGWLTRLLLGDVPKEIQLDLIEAAARRSSPALKEKLEKYQESKPKDDPIGEYREGLYGGSAVEGKKMFFERPEASCVRCHKINGEGGEVGPDLSKIGAQKDRQYLLESVVLPNKAIAPGFESVLVTLKSGTSYAGVLKSETADGLVINSPEDGLVTVKKNEIKTRDKGLSPMPEGMGQILSKQDLRNLVEFLSGLK